MWSPDRWNYAQAVERRRQQAREAIEDQNPEKARGTIEQLLDQQLDVELRWSPDQLDYFNAPATEQ